MKLILSLIAFTFLIPFFVFSQSSLVRNIEVYDNIVNKTFDELENRIVLAGSDNLYEVNLGDALDGDDYILTKLRQRFNRYNMVYGSGYDSVFADVRIDSIKLNTRYKNISTSKVLGDKTVDREISVSYYVSLVRKDDGTVLYSEKITESSKDNFKLDDLNRVESGNYGFLKGSLPEESFMGKYLLPIVLLGASVITIVLFFVIRSE